MSYKGWTVPNATKRADGYHDGDTVDVEATWRAVSAAPFNDPPRVHLEPLRFRVRLPGINAADLRGEPGKIVAAAVGEWLARGMFDVVSDDGDHYKYGGPPKWSRPQFMADLERNGERLTDYLLDHLLATYWDGTGARPGDGDTP